MGRLIVLLAGAAVLFAQAEGSKERQTYLLGPDDQLAIRVLDLEEFAEGAASHGTVPGKPEGSRGKTNRRAEAAVNGRDSTGGPPDGRRPAAGSPAVDAAQAGADAQSLGSAAASGFSSTGQSRM